MSKVIILGGDGFCGWPTALKFLNNNWDVLIIDNLVRRKIDIELNSNSLTNIASVRDRIETANSSFSGQLTFKNIDVSTQYHELLASINEFRPDAIIQFAEQRAAPYSMLGDKERRYTIDNNIRGTHNVCSAIVEVSTDIHLIHLGTMGVYGYSKDFGEIPEGYLDIKINQTNKDATILYPANPGSIYHMSKCLDQLIFQFYVKNWNCKITDLHQGIVWGASTDETEVHNNLVNRFDYDGIYGTVLNRFVTQAVNNLPLTVYGTGGQTRAFIHVKDTAECLRLAAENEPDNLNKVRIYNQVSETKSVKELAVLISEKAGVSINYVENPRKELPENELSVKNEGLTSLGFKPKFLDEALLSDITNLAKLNASNLQERNVLSSPKW